MYQYYCNDCGSYGRGHDERDEARRDGDMHEAETGHTSIEVHAATSGGGYEVVDENV